MCNKIINLTPHTINLYSQVTDDVPIMSIPSSGISVRVDTDVREVAKLEVDGRLIPVRDTRFCPVWGLPAPEDGTVYIVSRIVRDALGKGPDIRPDMLCPDTGLG